MSRPLRLEFAGAVYHVTARGQRRQPIYLDDTDRFVWLETLARICQRCQFLVHGFCQMSNHYHLLIETIGPNLSQGMRQLNGQYSQYFNRRHEVQGHLFQGRYHAVLVQKESHLRELARYVVLNPVRANMVASAEAWPWSSHAFMIQEGTAPPWLQTDWLLAQFGDSRDQAIDAYQRFVAAGMGLPSPLKELQHQLLLGDETFVLNHRSQAARVGLDEVNRAQRRVAAMSLAEYGASYPARESAVAAAYRSNLYTMAQIARHFGISISTVSRIILRAEVSSPKSS